VSAAAAVAAAPILEDEAQAAGVWLDVCALEDIAPDTGECALVGGAQIALVRVGEGDSVYAIDNFDPFSKAYVLSRGIVGDRGGVPKVASPMYKQSFSLVSGECLDDASVRVAVYPTRVRGGRVELQVVAGEAG
jgi:nitrite reductase (NADH) small subunit